MDTWEELLEWFATRKVDAVPETDITLGELREICQMLYGYAHDHPQHGGRRALELYDCLAGVRGYWSDRIEDDKATLRLKRM